MKQDLPTRILLIRHGETANADRRCYNGHYDVPLSENGRRQIESLAEKLKDEKVKVVYSSDLQRSMIGGGIFTKRFSVELHPRMELREINYGRWEGLTYNEIKTKYPDEIRDRLADIVNYRIKGGGENLIEFSQRIIPLLYKIVSNHKGETIVMITHGGVNRVILGTALNMDLKYIYRLRQDFAALNIIEFYENNEAMVVMVNG